MTYIIIEDEFLSAQHLEKLVKELRPSWHCIAKLESVEEAISYFKSNQDFGLLFCDIHLSDGNSFEIFEEVKTEQPVIFTTAFDQYAIEAFKVHSIHYLLKPVKKALLEEAIQKFEKTLSSTDKPRPVNLEALLQASQQKKKSRFLVKKGKKMKIVPVEEVAYFYSSEGITFLFTTDSEKILINETLDQLESELEPDEFFRANRQYILHIQSIAEIEPYFKGKLFIHLNPKQQEDCVVSQAKAAGFKEWVGA